MSSMPIYSYTGTREHYEFLVRTVTVCAQCVSASSIFSVGWHLCVENHFTGFRVLLSWLWLKFHIPQHRSTYHVERGCVVIKQCCTVHAEFIHNLLWVKQPCKCQQHLTTSIRHISRQTSKVCWTVAETMEFLLDVNSQLIWDNQHKENDKALQQKLTVSQH